MIANRKYFIVLQHVCDIFNTKNTIKVCSAKPNRKTQKRKTTHESMKNEFTYIAAESCIRMWQKPQPLDAQKTGSDDCQHGTQMFPTAAQQQTNEIMCVLTLRKLAICRNEREERRVVYRNEVKVMQQRQ